MTGRMAGCRGRRWLLPIGLASCVMMSAGCEKQARKPTDKAAPSPAVRATLEQISNTASISRSANKTIAPALSAFADTLTQLADSNVWSVALFTNENMPAQVRYQEAKKWFYANGQLAAYSNTVLILESVVNDADDETLRNEALWMLGVAYEKVGNTAEAYGCLKRLVDRCQEGGADQGLYRAALDALADVCRDMGCFEEAIAYNQRFIEMAETDSQRMSGQLMVILSELQQHPNKGDAALKDFLANAPDKKCGAYMLALTIYYQRAMEQDLSRALANMPNNLSDGATKEHYEQVLKKLSDKYFESDGSPRPLHVINLEQGEAK